MSTAPLPPTSGPLREERVLDLSDTVAGRFCAKLLGDLGADVVKVERPGTAVAADDVTELAERLYFDSTKRSVVLDLGTDDDRAVLAQLVARHDIVIADGPDEALAGRGLDLATLRRWNPSVVLTTVSGFGSTGPYAAYRWNHLVACAMGTWSLTCGRPEREPLQVGGRTTETVTGAYAAAATLGAVEGRARHGRGDRVDVSAWEAAITCAMGPTAVFQQTGALGERHSDYMTGPSFNIRCRDGYVGVNALTEVQWQTACLYAGRPDMADDPRFGDFYGRLEYVEEIRAAFDAAFCERSAQEVFEEAQTWRLPFGLVLSPRQALALPSHAERAYLVPEQHPVAGRYLAPRVPFLMSATPSTTVPAPTPGQHDAQVRAEAAAAGPPTPRAGGEEPLGPLAGLRVLDLTMFMSGPLATQIAADLGADVVKIEAVQRLDGWRGVGRGGLRPWENSLLFNWLNRTKRGITLNLADRRGADLFRRLVATADVVVENYTPRVMENFGLGYEQLRAIRPDLIMLSMPGFGTTGTCRDFAAFAWTTEQMSTITHLTGYPDDGPLFTGTTFGDPLAGLMGALAMLGAINHRRRTGEGQFIDLSQVEASTAFVGEKLIEAQLGDVDPGRVGNASRTDSPHGNYPCRDERWIAIACGDDEQWRLTWEELGSGPLPYATRAERLGDRAGVDALVGRATADRDAFELMRRLQAAGVPAAVVMNGQDLLEDEHLAAWFLDHDRAEIGRLRYPGPVYHYRDAWLPEPRRTAYLGEHNEEIFGGELGRSSAELAALARDDIIGHAPLGAEVPRPEATVG